MTNKEKDFGDCGANMVMAVCELSTQKNRARLDCQKTSLDEKIRLFTRPVTLGHLPGPISDPTPVD